MKVKKKMMKTTEKKPFSSWSLTKKPLVAKRKKVLRVVVVLPLQAFKKMERSVRKKIPFYLLSLLCFVLANKVERASERQTCARDCARSLFLCI